MPAPSADAHKAWWALLFDSVTSRHLAVARPALDLSAKGYQLGIFAVLLASLVLQLTLAFNGLYSIAADESARALYADQLTLANAFAASDWPPFYKILNGVALKLYDDLFVTPRILVNVFGLGTLAAIMLLARQLFDNRLVVAVAGAVAVVVPQRLILSVAAMSDIYACFFGTLSAYFLIGWLRNESQGAKLICASVCLMFLAMVRYETWIVNAVLGLYLAYRTLIRRDLGFWPFFVNGAILSAFPLAWIALTYVHDGSLARFGTTSMQFLDLLGPDYVAALKGDTLVKFSLDVLLRPALIVGALALTYFLVVARDVRTWAILLFGPLVIIGVLMFFTFSIPEAEPFRTDALWVMLLLPFSAWTLVLVAERVGWNGSSRYAALAVLAYVAMAPEMVATKDRINYTRIYGAANIITKPELALGTALKALLAVDPRNVLLDAIENFGYLNVLVVSNAPERFVLNVDADPLKTARYVGATATYLKRNDRAIIDTYLTDKFGILNGLDRRALKARNIGHILVRSESYIEALDSTPGVARVDVFGSWVLYRLTKG